MTRRALKPFTAIVGTVALAAGVTVAMAPAASATNNDPSPNPTSPAVSYEWDCTGSSPLGTQTSPLITSTDIDTDSDTADPTGGTFDVSGTASVTLPASMMAGFWGSPLTPSAKSTVTLTETFGSTDGHATGSYTYEHEFKSDGQPKGAAISGVSYDNGSTTLRGDFSEAKRGWAVADGFGGGTGIPDGATITKINGKNSATISEPVTADSPKGGGPVGAAPALTMSDPDFATTGGTFTTDGSDGDQSGIGVIPDKSTQMEVDVLVPLTFGASDHTCVETGWSADGSAHGPTLGDKTDPATTAPLLPAGTTTPLVGTSPAKFPAGAYVTLQKPGTAPSITQQPKDQSVTAGDSASLTAKASGSPTPSAQWQVSSDSGSSWKKVEDGSDISGATTGTLALADTTTSQDGNEYRAVFTNDNGSATTDPATLTVTSSGGNPPGGGGTNPPGGGGTNPPPSGLSVSVSPSTGLSDGEPVHVTGSNFTPGTNKAAVVECAGSELEMDNCDFPLPQSLVTVSNDGTFATDVTVHDGDIGSNDAACPCSIVAADISDLGSVGGDYSKLPHKSASLTFGTSGGNGNGNGSGNGNGGIHVKGVSAERIGGDSRYVTSALIAGEFGTADAVVIANGSSAKDGVDALSANYLAGRVGAPILLTKADTVPEKVLSAVKKVLDGASDPTIYVMGKTDSVSDAAADYIKSAAESVATGTVTVTRVAGADRYQTSAKAAEQAGEVQTVTLDSSSSPEKTAILASGTVNADALAAAPLSDAMGIPVLLTDGTTLDTHVAAAIKDLGITQLLVLGGKDRVSQAVLDATGIGADHTVRIAGDNRFATSAELYAFALGTMGYGDGDQPATYLGNSYGGFPDVLSSGPRVAQTQSALLTVGHGDGLDPQVQKYLSKHSSATIVALGLTDRVSDAQLSEARKLAGE